MRVRARPEAECKSPPETLRFYLGQSLITPGREYEVHAITVFEGVTAVQIINDLDFPNWRPAWLFEITDNALPDDWICSFWRSEPSLVLGPDFLAKDEEAYRSMVELEPEQVDRFWSRIQSRQRTDE